MFNVQHLSTLKPTVGKVTTTPEPLRRSLSMALRTPLLWGLVGAAACVQPPDAPCRLSEDCAPDQACVSARCLSRQPPESTTAPSADLAGASPAPHQGPHVEDTASTAARPDAPLFDGLSGEICADASPPWSGSLVLNEVLTAVPADAQVGDANRDGRRDAREDEFVELVNRSDALIKVRGVQLFKNDDDEPIATLRTPCLAPGQGLVLFGGLAEGHPAPLFPASWTEIADTSLSMPNQGLRLRLLAPDGVLVDEALLSAAAGSAWTRWPQLDPQARWRPHDEVASTAMSPGHCADGAVLMTGCSPPPSPCPGASPVSPGSLVINEVLTAVPSGEQGDANQDGERSARGDEFMEVVFTGTAPGVLDALIITKDGDPVASVPAPICLNPGQALLLFAGAARPLQPSSFGPDVVVRVSDRPWALSNAGVSVGLLNAEGEQLADAHLGPAQGESLTRERPWAADSPWTPHSAQSPSGALFSPGACANEAPWGACR